VGPVPDAGRSGSVSYTHLDVYKRQKWHRSRGHNRGHSAQGKVVRGNAGGSQPQCLSEWRRKGRGSVVAIGGVFR